MNILSIDDVAELLGVAKSTVWRLHTQEESFPEKIQISPGRVGYRESDLEEWLEERTDK